MTLVEKILACDTALATSGIPYAFGGALALAWCTKSARATIDIDLNIFTDPVDATSVLELLPKEVQHSKKLLKTLTEQGQVRLWWEHTPLDVFLNSTPYHLEVSTRVTFESFGGRSLPFLHCRDLAVFKAFFNRTKDWADLEAMAEAGTLETDFVTSILDRYLDADDERIAKLRALSSR